MVLMVVIYETQGYHCLISTRMVSFPVRQQNSYGMEPVSQWLQCNATTARLTFRNLGQCFRGGGRN